MSAVVKEAYRLMESTPDDIHPAQSLEEFQPLTKGQYPVFNKYPKFIVDYQVQGGAITTVSFLTINTPEGEIQGVCWCTFFLSYCNAVFYIVLHCTML